MKILYLYKSSECYNESLEVHVKVVGTCPALDQRWPVTEQVASSIGENNAAANPRVTFL